MFRSGRAVQTDNLHGEGASVVRAATISVPSSILPDVSSVTCAWMGTERPLSRKYSTAPSMAAFNSEDILHRLDYQEVAPTLDKRFCLLFIDGFQLLVSNI